MNPPDDFILLKDARDQLWDQVNDGVTCPCCQQRAQVYWRSINKPMAMSAIRLYRWMLNHPGEYAHLPTVLGRRSAEEAKLRYWGLIEEQPAARADGGRNGCWRLTYQGEMWVRGHLALHRYARVYNGRRIGNLTSYSRSGQLKPKVIIRDALGSAFDYDALMRGEG